MLLVKIICDDIGNSWRIPVTEENSVIIMRFLKAQQVDKTRCCGWCAEVGRPGISCYWWALLPIMETANWLQPPSRGLSYNLSIRQYGPPLFRRRFLYAFPKRFYFLFILVFSAHKSVSIAGERVSNYGFPSPLPFLFLLSLYRVPVSKEWCRRNMLWRPPKFVWLVDFCFVFLALISGSSTAGRQPKSLHRGTQISVFLPSHF